MYIYIYMTDTCTHIRIYTYIYMYTCLYVYTFIYVLIHKCRPTCIMRVYTYTSMHEGEMTCVPTLNNLSYTVQKCDKPSTPMNFRPDTPYEARNCILLGTSGATLKHPKPLSGTRHEQDPVSVRPCMAHRLGSTGSTRKLQLKQGPWSIAYMAPRGVTLVGFVKQRRSSEASSLLGSFCSPGA